MINTQAGPGAYECQGKVLTFTPLLHPSPQTIAFYISPPRSAFPSQTGSLSAPQITGFLDLSASHCLLMAGLTLRPGMHMLWIELELNLDQRVRRISILESLSHIRKQNPMQLHWLVVVAKPPSTSTYFDCHKDP